MLGVLITLLVTASAVGMGLLTTRKLLDELDPWLRIGTAGLLGLGFLGLLTFFVGIAGLLNTAGIALVAVFVGIGGFGLWKNRGSLATGKPQVSAPILGVLVLAFLMALVSVLAPADIGEWDTLAYHLAVPKLWIEEGRINFIPYIHQSNFPFVVDNLYIWGLQWGGESGARAFQLGFYLLGMLAVFGVTRQQYGDKAAWWAVLTFATVPSILWEAGTAYIDLAHGIYAGLGILFAARYAAKEARQDLWLAALMLGFAAGSKYTGLQTIFAVALVLFIAAILAKRPADGVKSAAIVGIVGLVVAAPWLARNVVNTGNPVYPFFYEQMGASNWDQRRADIYRNEQKSFGLKPSPDNLGHAVLGLAYQPGRYVNPAQDRGLGSPLGAIGAAVLSALFLWMISGRIRRYEGVIVGSLIVSIAMWFVLSQQSRYIITWAIPLAVLLGGGVERLRTFGKPLAIVAAIQAAVSLALMGQLRTSMQAQTVFGDFTRAEYQKATIPFYEAAQTINTEVKGGKVALYDEVFGYLLDVPYFWANPGHSTVIPYDDLADGNAFADKMAELGFTHIYLNPMAKDPQTRDKWLAAMGFGDGAPFSEEERKAHFDNWETKWMILIADAAKQRRLEPVQVFRTGILFRLR